ncbi:MAG: carbohydrate kinase [Anaerolineales bacterium]|nr:carbohydrate kinase [Anaerolineales bacterium]
MADQPLLAGIDIGTTNIKAVIFEPTGSVVAGASVSTPIHYPQPGWAYYDPTELWQAAVTVLRQATDQIADTGRIVSVAVASAGEAAVPLDAQGRPTYDAIAWFDQRTQPQTEWLAHAIGQDRLFEISGLSLQPIFGLCKLLWIKENQPEAFARTVRWLNLADYIAYKLCGVPATDYSLASRTLVLDLQKLQWHEPLIREVGLRPDLFAPLCPSGAVLGHITPAAAQETGLPTTVQVAAGGHDHVCGALAVGVTQPGLMLNSMGTAEAIFLPLEKPLLDPTMGQQGYTQGAHVVGGQYYVLIGLYTSGACVDWLREIMGETTDFTGLIAEAEQVPPGSLGVCFLPHLRFANPPHDDPKGRGAFIGLSTDAKRGVLFRALLEGLAYEARYSLETLLAYPGMAPLQQTYISGGSTRNRLLVQLRATILNQPLIMVDVAEATSLGAAILGGLGAGIYADTTSVGNTIRHNRITIDPVPDNVPVYNAYFEQVYKHIYASLRDLHHRVYQLQQS